MALRCGYGCACLLVAVSLLALLPPAPALEEVDDDFDEFEFEIDGEEESAAPRQSVEDADVDVEDEDLVVEIEEEEEEEEGAEERDWDSDEFEGGKSRPTMDNLKIAETSVRVRPFWQAYVVEGLVVAGMLLYVINYLVGRTRNSALAQAWLDKHRQLLQDNFALVGDTGEGGEPSECQLIPESDHVFRVWASGRVNCSGLLAQIKLKKRHDLLSLLYSIVKPQTDTVTLVVQLGDEEAEPVVLAVGKKKAVQRMAKEYQDLSQFCAPPRSGARLGLDDAFFVMSELPEALPAFLTKSILTALNKHAAIIESLHVSDQYTGFVESTEDSEVVVVKKPQKRLQLTYNLEEGEEGVLGLALVAVDHVRAVRLSREARDKALKHRSKVVQGLEKLQHAQRQEAAQLRKEEKKKAEKERMMLETDPDKTRKWEEKEHKKAMKRMQPRMQKMKVRM